MHTGENKEFKRGSSLSRPDPMVPDWRVADPPSPCCASTLSRKEKLHHCFCNTKDQPLPASAVAIRDLRETSTFLSSVLSAASKPPEMVTTGVIWRYTNRTELAEHKA